MRRVEIKVIVYTALDYTHHSCNNRKQYRSLTIITSALQRTANTLPALLLLFLPVACSDQAWNNPYPVEDSGKNILYSQFSSRPKHLDPVQSYSSNEIAFTGQIYEPPLQYHFLKRPYELIPLTATGIPTVQYFDKSNKLLPGNTDEDDIAFSIYEIKIQAGIRYQPHPAFAKDEAGNYRYHDLSADDIDRVFTLADFDQTGSRELTAADYIYEMKRLAHPRLHSPIFGLMTKYIVGLKELGTTLREANKAQIKKEGKKTWLDLRKHTLSGVEEVDRYTYRIKLYGKYPQFLYWLAMPFFAPVPPEVDRFYAQSGLDKKNISLDWYPVGTGPYMLTKNNPNLQMVLERNPEFHGETYPLEGQAGDEEAGFLRDAGKPLPFVDKVIYSLEKESIPGWNKFLQGYYDASGISSDSFDQAISTGSQGEIALSDAMKAKGIKLITGVATSSYYMGFNMRDPVVGGKSERARKLRQAISIAIDNEEHISIFRNGRGIPAQGPLPPGISGYRAGKEGINPYMYDWQDGKPKRKPVSVAKKLLSEAGYPGGRDEETGKPLIIYLDTPASGPGDKANMDWYRKQFSKIDLQLVVRGTDYNRFQDKMRKGTAQLFQWGWNADYPDPENFMFLLYGPNGRVGKGGANSANYSNPEFDRLFDRMKNMENGDLRQGIIDQMTKILRHDSPWVWGVHPKNFSLYHDWYYNAKPNLMANNTLKYKRVDPVLRGQKRAEWNVPVVWPVIMLIVVLILGVVPAIKTYRARARAAGVE